MNRAQMESWIAAYERAWRTAGTDSLAELFAPEATYQMEPYESPYRGLEAIADLWDRERKGHDEVFTMSSEIVAVEGNTGVARVEVRYGEPTPREYRDLWIVKLDGAGRCTAFEEWPLAPGRTRRGRNARGLGGSLPTKRQKGEAFRALHEGKAFIIPNPWDAGSAKAMAGLGFKALATTSSGFAMTLGRRDGKVTLDEVAEHVRALDQATELPVSVDLENGYGPDPEHAATAITRAAGAGAVGGSIEDYDPEGEGRIYELDHAVERVAAAAEAARRLDFPFTLTGRAENHIRGNPDVDDTIARLQAYERAGADVLYAPGLRSGEEIRAVRAATSKPLNVLARPRLTMSEIVEAGGQRISLGGWLAFVAMSAMAAAAGEMLERGDFSSLRTDARIIEWLD